MEPDGRQTNNSRPISRSAQDVLGLLGTILEWPRLQTGQKLDLLSTQINDRELETLLASLHDLRFLSLAETRIGDAGLAHLQSLTHLQELHLDHTEITDEGLKLLSSLPHLEILDLKGTKITDAGLATVGRLTRLKGLYLTRTGITDDGLAHLKGLNDLETLILWDTGIGDAGLEHLKTLKRLREVILWNTRVTREGADGAAGCVARLRREHHHVRMMIFLVAGMANCPCLSGQANHIHAHRAPQRRRFA